MDPPANVTQNAPGQIFTPAFIIGYSVAIGIVLSIGMLSNVVAIFIISKTATLQTTTNIHLIGLCIADCIHLLSSPILLSVMILQHFVFNDFICKSFMLAQGVNWFAGTFLLSSMSVHRYLSVRFPLSLQIIHRKRCALINVSFLWILAFLLLSPLAIFSVRVERKMVDPITGEEMVKAACVINWSTGKPSPWWESNLSRVFSAYTFVLGFFLPVVVNSVVYSMLIHHLRRKRRILFEGSRRSLGKTLPIMPTHAERVSNSDESQACVQEEIIPIPSNEQITENTASISTSVLPPRKLDIYRRRLSWKVASLVLIYVILWAPYWVQQIVISFARSITCFSSPRLAFITQLLGYCNSAVNPIIYTCLSTPFRKNILRVLKRRCKCGIWIKTSEEDQKQFTNQAVKQHECFADGCPFLCKCFCDY